MVEKSGWGLMMSCRFYETAQNELNEAKKNLKISFVIFIVSLFIIVTGILDFYPASDLMRSDIITGITLISFLGGLIMSLWNFKEFKLKEKLEVMLKGRLYSDYRVNMIDDKSIWFDIKGKLIPIQPDKIDDAFMKMLLNDIDKISN